MRSQTHHGGDRAGSYGRIMAGGGHEQNGGYGRKSIMVKEASWLEAYHGRRESWIDLSEFMVEREDHDKKEIMIARESHQEGGHGRKKRVCRRNTIVEMTGVHGWRESCQ